MQGTEGNKGRLKRCLRQRKGRVDTMHTLSHYTPYGHHLVSYLVVLLPRSGWTEGSRWQAANKGRIGAAMNERVNGSLDKEGFSAVCGGGLSKVSKLDYKVVSGDGHRKVPRATGLEMDYGTILYSVCHPAGKSWWMELVLYYSSFTC